MYGYKGNFGFIFFGSGDGSNFKSGSIDEFDVSSINMKYNVGIVMIYIKVWILICKFCFVFCRFL